jgi:hypothetical protein
MIGASLETARVCRIGSWLKANYIPLEAESNLGKWKKGQPVPLLIPCTRDRPCLDQLIIIYTETRPHIATQLDPGDVCLS